MPMSVSGLFWLTVFVVVGLCFLSGGNCAGGNNNGSVAVGSPWISSVVRQARRNGTSRPVVSNSNVGNQLNSNDRMRIIGGVETARNEFPFIVSFARNGRHFCGGSIIAPEWVLTASHCASEADFDVTAGEHKLDVNEGTEQKSRAVMVIRNANYNPITYEDDICLVKVHPPYRYDKYVQQFAVPTTHYVANGNATVAGWGTEDEAFQVVSPVLRKVTVPLVPSIECSSQYGSYFHPLKMMCAGEEEGGKDACQGDSGGPLMCDDYHKGATLCGVVSFGLGCARPELAGVYTKVAYYSDWIEYQMRINSKQGGGPLPPPMRRTTYRPPQQTTPAPPQTPGNPYDKIPPGYVVIIKPVNSSHVHPPYERPRHNGKSGSTSSRWHASCVELYVIVMFSSLALAFKLN